MVRLHTLESMNEQTAASQVNSLRLGLDGSLDGATRPEGMVHGTPRVLMVSSIVCGSILTKHETGGRPREGQIHDAVFVDRRLDGVGVGFFVERHTQVVSPKRKHTLIEHEVRQRIRAPIMRSVTLEIVDLGVELSGGVDAPIDRKQPPRNVSNEERKRNIQQFRQLLHNVTVDNLNHDQSSVVGHGIKCLSLHVGVLVGLPPQVFLGHLSKPNSLCLLRNRLDGIRAIFGFLGTGDTGQAAYGISI